MKYKALICDFDGTLRRHDSQVISLKVLEALRKAEKVIPIGIATGRPFQSLDKYMNQLVITGPCIVNGGAQIVDPIEKKVLWSRGILLPDAKEIVDIVIRELIPEHFIINDGAEDLPLSAFNPNTVYFQIGHDKSPLREVQKYAQLVKHIPTIATHIVTSDVRDLYFSATTHAEATKQHGIYEAAKILGIKPHEIIGIGDGGNDLPLLMACGLKVAMGNASEDLKAIADYVAPTVDEDGVARVIEKFILQ